MSQAALAGGDLDASYISLLESGRRSPTDSVLQVLARRLGVTVGDLRGDDEPRRANNVTLAEAALGLGRPEEALRLLGDQLDAVRDARSIAADRTTFLAAVAAASAYERLGRLAEAASVLQSVSDAAAAAPHRLPFLDTSIARVRVHRDAGDLSYAIELGEAAVGQARAAGLEQASGFSALVSTLAGVYAERGDLLRAQLLLDGLVEAASHEGTDDDRAAALWNAAITAAERGQAVEGLQLIAEAHRLLTPAAGARAAARIQLPRAWLLLAQAPPRAEEARDILRAALPALRQYGGAEDLGSAETELARCELLLGRPEVARRHARSALRSLGPDQRVERARALAALGASLLDLDEAAAGIDSLDEAAALLSDLGASRQAAATWRQLATCYRAMGDDARAQEATGRALDAAGIPDAALLPAVGTPPTARPPRRSRARNAGRP